MIKYIKEDVTNITYGVVAHGCNCQGVMGSGVAKAIRAKWPKAYDEYKAHNDAFPGFELNALLGEVVFVNVASNNLDQLYVANCFTQENYGKDGKVYADFAAVGISLDATIAFAKARGIPLYMPRIGCGLGGLDWDTQVGPLVEALSTEYEITVYVCDL